MAATNTTTNYGFPLYNESDSTSWADFNKLSTDVDTQIKNVADSGGTTSEQVQELTTKVDTLTQTVNAQDAVITQQGTEITRLTNDAATTDEAIDALQQKSDANEANISNLSTQVTGTILPEVQSNTTDIAALTGNVNTLSATVSQQGTRITSLEGKVPNDLGAQLTTLTNGLDSVEAEIAGGLAVSFTTTTGNYGIHSSDYNGNLIVAYDSTPKGLYAVDLIIKLTVTPSQSPRTITISCENSSGQGIVVGCSPTTAIIPATSNILQLPIYFLLLVTDSTGGFALIRTFDVNANQVIPSTQQTAISPVIARKLVALN